MISDAAAVATAREAVRGRLDVPESAPADVARTDDAITVQFPASLSDGVRGPDFLARVVLDARSGDVLEVLAGS